MTPLSFSSRHIWAALASNQHTFKNSRLLLKPAGKLVKYPLEDINKDKNRAEIAHLAFGVIYL